MDLFAIPSVISFDAPEPYSEPAGIIPIDAIPANHLDGGGNGGCVVA